MPKCFIKLSYIFNLNNKATVLFFSLYLIILTQNACGCCLLGIQSAHCLFDPIDVRTDTRVHAGLIFFGTARAPRHNSGQKEFIVVFTGQWSAAIAITCIDTALQ